MRTTSDLRKDQILRAVNRYFYVTMDLLVDAMGLGLRTLQYDVKGLLNEDYPESGYLKQIVREKRHFKGTVHPAYRIGNKGYDYLKEHGVLTYRPHDPSPWFLNHTLGVNRVLIDTENMMKRYPQYVRLEEVVHERILKRMKLLAEPDLFARFSIYQRGVWVETPILLEYDTGTEREDTWFPKIERYIDFLDGQYQNQFQTDVVTVATVTLGGQARVTELKNWTTRRLKKFGRADLLEYFLFSRNLPVDELYFTDCFEIAGSSKTARLLEVLYET